jgi:hypothetical protein
LEQVETGLEIAEFMNDVIASTPFDRKKEASWVLTPLPAPSRTQFPLL